MGVKWTEEQIQVINHRKGNLLVSAAAGSGKTAVLVAHIMSRLLDKDNPLDISRLLIVTFTEAAAAEMRDRLIQALEDAMEDNPDDERIAEQVSLVGLAHIQTIDSFCMWLVRNNFHRLDIDPDFRIAEEGEGRLIREDVLEELLDEKYEEGSPEFLSFVDRYASSRDDTAVGELIQNMYTFSQSAPDPDAWLASCLEAVSIDTEALDDYQWAEELAGRLRIRLSGLRDLLLSAADEADAFPCLDSLRETLESEAAELGRMIVSEHSLESLIKAVRAFKKGRMTHRKVHDEEPAVRDYLKHVHEAFSDELKDIIKNYAFTEPEEMIEVLRESARPVFELSGLTREFARRYSSSKKEKNLADFSDVEHWALELLRDKEAGISELAKEISLQFDEIAVDEYQDSNLIQEQILTAVSGASRGCPNMFMVGDVKQSIYKFRMARPELFMEKYDRYPDAEGGDERLVELSKNFRTRSTVLDVVNHVFFRIMKRGLGGVEYTDSCALHAGAAYPEPPSVQSGQMQPPAELLLSICPAREDRTETEAKAIAEKIHSMMDPDNGLKLWDAESGTFRPVRYRDIAILMRRLRGKANVFEETLRSHGIPAASSQSTGYFDEAEVQVLLNALAVIDNPAQDIPLASVMLSPMTDFVEDDLAIAAAWYRKEKTIICTDSNDADKTTSAMAGGELYAAVRLYARRGPDAELGSRLERFLIELDELRDFAVHNTIYDLIGEILRVTGYDLYVLALPAGRLRLLNIEMLRQKAEDFEKTSYHGIFQFNRYIEKLRRYEVDFGTARTESEEEDVVRIMSIHKSKGLEFPVVFVCSCEGSFDKRDSIRSVILHDDLGAAADFVDIEHAQKRKSLWKSVVADRIRQDNKGEELRVLYVAMTRAKEKLILSASLKETSSKAQEDLIDDIRKSREAAEEMGGLKLPVWYVSHANSYLDWLLMAFCGEPSLIPITIRKIEDLKEEAAIREIEDKVIRSELDTLPMADDDTMRRWKKLLDCSYRYADSALMKGVWSVSELKAEAYEAEAYEAEAHEAEAHEADAYGAGTQDTEVYMSEERVVDANEIAAREAGMNGTESFENHARKSEIKDAFQPGGAVRGTAYHRVLQLMPPSQDAGTVRAWINSSLPRSQAKLVNPEDIAGFYRSPSGCLCLKPGVKRHTEQPFVFGIPQSEFEAGRRDGFAGWHFPEKKSSPDEDLILLQGIIDLYLEEEDGITLIDYKTDSVSPDRLRELYSVQLRCYAMALSRITGKKVKKICIYSFFNRCEVTID